MGPLLFGHPHTHAHTTLQGGIPVFFTRGPLKGSLLSRRKAVGSRGGGRGGGLMEREQKKAKKMKNAAHPSDPTCVTL